MLELKVDRDPMLLVLRMDPPWEFIDEIRRFVEAFCGCACPERQAELALAAHELMQNAIANATRSQIELSLGVDKVRDVVSVVVSNACTREQADSLKRRLAAMYEEPDALRSYLRIMTESSPEVHGGLGLARVRCEAQLDVHAAFDGRRVTVTALGKLRALTKPSKGAIDA